MYVSRTSDIRVLVNLWTDTNVDSIKFTSIQGSSFKSNWEYDSNSESFTPSSVIAGTVQVSNLTVKAGKFNITNKSSSTQKVVKGNSDEVTIFDGEITAKSGKVSVNDLILRWSFDPSANFTDNDQISLTVYVNWEAYADSVYRTGEVKFSNLGDVDTSNSMKLKITAQPTIANTWSITFAISANGTDSNGNAVTAPAVNAAKLQITDGANITVASSNATSTVVRDGSNAELLTFTSTVKDWSYDLHETTIELNANSDVLDGQTVTLEIDWSAVDSITYCKTAAAGCDTIWTGIIFTALNETLSAGNHTFTLKANLNVVAGWTTANTITIKSVKIDGKDAKNINVKKLVMKAFPLISSKVEGDDLVLTISNPEDSDEDITIVGFDASWTGVSASINEKVIEPSDVSTFTLKGTSDVITESIAPGNKIEFRIQAEQWSTVQVSSIILDAGTINSDYTNVGKWSSFKVTAKK